MLFRDAKIRKKIRINKNKQKHINKSLFIVQNGATKRKKSPEAMAASGLIMS